MAASFSLESSTFTLALFAYDASELLRKTLNSVETNKRIVLELGEELIQFQTILRSLEGTLKTNTDITDLKLPLLRCGRACQELAATITKCATISHGIRVIKDWTKVRYAGEDVTGFRIMLRGYKATIKIALWDTINMHTANISPKSLDDYKAIIDETVPDLEDQLEEINRKAYLLSKRQIPSSSEVGGQRNLTEGDRERIEEDKKSIQRCIEVCLQVSTHIDQIRSAQVQQGQGAPSTSSEVKKITTDPVTGTRVELSSTTGPSKKQLEDIQLRLNTLRKRIELSGDPGTEEVKELVAICSEISEQAHSNRINLFEDITSAEDAEQIIVVTTGDLLSAKSVATGTGSRQWLGQMSDESFQYLARGEESTGQQSTPKHKSHVSNIFKGRHGAV
ncbi:hypothetical protein TWF694_008162 [Orbilia ellipsospora]|uniref:Azaphilone pigments biosynthesis cluster protein L N-terminal domain-containing protein n=1 Tax=Orbilia ellipsospora TaxID=2528407 RepID=A0AAV9XIM7_9PEZI